jgi:hypothetical protein
MQKTRVRLVVCLVAAIATLTLGGAPAPASRAHAAKKHTARHHCKRRPARHAAGTHCRSHVRHARATAKGYRAARPPERTPSALIPSAFPDRPFAATSFWNAPLAGTAPLAPTSSSLVAELRRQVDRDLALRRGPWINTTFYSSPIYRVPTGQPAVRVKLDQWNPAMQAAFDAVPIPPDARAAAGTDANMVVWQPSTDTMWEFWLMRRATDGWHAKWGGRMTGVSTNPGRYDNNWGAPATSLPQIGGTITIAELRAGRIDHALAMAVPEPRRGVFVWPARRTDGISDSPLAIPEGTRFRLDPALDVEKLALPPATRILARAAQRYGMVVRDKSANVTLYAEDPTPTGRDPYPALLGGLPPNKVLAAFPWDRLVALSPDEPKG